MIEGRCLRQRPRAPREGEPDTSVSLRYGEALILVTRLEFSEE
jgi:hypothetical protein